MIKQYFARIGTLKGIIIDVFDMVILAVHVLFSFVVWAKFCYLLFILKS